MRKSNKTIGISSFSGFSGKIYFGAHGINRDGLPYWKSKTEISESDFVHTMLEYIRQKANDEGVMTITANGKPTHTLKLTKLKSMTLLRDIFGEENEEEEDEN